MAEESEYTFRGRRSGEKVLLTVRQHVWLLMPIVIVWLLLIAAIIVLFTWLGASKISSFGLVAILLFGGLYSFYQWFLWNNGTYIITNQRVIKIEQNSLFDREIAEAEIERIQEISTEIKGPIRTMLNFGTVKIQTASNTGNVDLENVTNPYDIQQEIVRIQHEAARPAPINRSNQLR